MPASDYLTIRQWPFSPETTRTFTFGTHLESATLSPDATRFCFIQNWDERRVHIARAADGQILTSSIPIQAGGTGSALAWSGDSRLIAVVSDGTFVFFRASDLAVIGSVPCKHPSSVAFLPGMEELVLGSWNTTTIMKLGDAVKSLPFRTTHTLPPA